LSTITLPTSPTGPTGPTRTVSVLDLLEDAATGTGHIRCGVADDWSTLGEVWERAGRLGQSLARLAGPTGVVAMALHASPACVTALLGAWRAGLTVASVPGPGRGASVEEYLDQVHDQCRRAEATALLVSSSYLPLTVPGVDVVGYESLATGAPTSLDAGVPALIQFTSGSTSAPKGVCLTLEAIGANVASILDHIQIEGRLAICSWLPLSHDMGLIGMLLTGWSAQGARWTDGRGHLFLMAPEDFIRRPSSWLQACSDINATHTAGPDFALRLAARRVPAAIDLSHLRAVVVGAEPVRAQTLRTFADATAEAGFWPRALRPAYGLAEATLGVTMVGPDDTWCSRWVDPDALLEGGWAPGPPEHGVELVCAGRRLPNMEVRIGGNVPVGPVEVRGPSTLSNYLGIGDPRDSDGWFRTSDFGHVDEAGHLWIGGRTDDVIFAAGRNLFARELEGSLDGAGGFREGSFAIVPDGDGRYVIVGERGRGRDDDDGNARAVCAALARRCGIGPSAVAFLPRGRFRKTPSGKLQRAKLSALYRSGELGADKIVRFT
jgi:acyl-CoA synthetase (AMP-forming)/AMP-acid ligase II